MNIVDVWLCLRLAGAIRSKVRPYCFVTINKCYRQCTTPFTGTVCVGGSAFFLASGGTC